MDFFCSFCSKAEQEVSLIDLSTNLLFINKNHYDFAHLFYDLFMITVNDLPSNFICEVCKDSVVQFFIFKSNAFVQVNRHRRMIISQIEDFLNQSKISIEDIQVIRKLSSITLQVDEQPINDSTAATIIHAIEQHEDNDSFIDEDYEELISETDQEDEEIKIKSQIDEAIVVSDYLPCLKCGEVMTSKRSSELHYFLKHSMLGIQIENEVEQSEEVFVGNDGKPTFIKKCRSCGSDFQDSSSLRYHLLVTHCDEVLLNIYELLAIDTTSKKLEIANNYLDYIKDLMQTSDGDLVVDENVKSYFYQFYSCDATDNAEPFTCTSEDRVFNVIDHEVQVNPSEKAKPEKNSIDLNVEGRAWIRREINLRKKTIQTEKGTQVVYRCAYCNSHSSNSAPGFRYHLLSKHLKNKNFQDLHEIRSDLETQQPKKTDSLKNICIECNLKLKDSKTLKTHRDSHELFETVAEHYFFPSCNTCSKIFIDDSTLKLHLANHNIRDNVEDPIAVPLGSLIMQGKQIDYIEISHYPEADDDNFWWSCGHCSRKFQQEFSCRDHLLKFHVSSFTCPIDKRIFSGNKSVSLFSHHLRNKHPELFPNVTFSCTFCKMSFSSIYEKLSHMKNCDLKKFFCDHCGKRFFKKGELVSHLRFVSGELYFACKECYKKFENLSDLKIHLRSHTKEKPFPCSICNKKFRTLATRVTHMDSHSTNTLYTCICGKPFKQRNLYLRHLRAVHGNDTKTQNISVLVKQPRFEMIEDEVL